MFKANKAESRQSRSRMSLAHRKSHARMSMRAGARASMVPGTSGKQVTTGKPAASWVTHLNVGDVLWVNKGTIVQPRWCHAVAKSRSGKKITVTVSNAYLEKGDTPEMEVSATKTDVIAPGNKSQLAVIEDKDYTKANMLATNAAAAAGFVDDMTSLNHINEPSIIHVLEGRSKIQDAVEERVKCFTYMANVLIAVNPCFNPNKKLLDPDLMSFVNSSERVPHPYSIAEMAFQQMVSATKEDTQNQSIVISGESGAGKTESAKIVLRHLTSRDQQTSSLDKRMLQSNPVLEAFGNAKTQRNNNSSRFGKFMKLEFSRPSRKVDPSLTGGVIESYLLERSRLVTAITGERNFHIFYQLLSEHGVGSSGVVTKLAGKVAGDFHFLKRNDCTTAVGVDDSQEFALVTEGLDTVGMEDEQKNGLFQLLSGLLYLGNVDFEDESLPDGSERAIVSAKTQEDSQLAADLLGVEGGTELMLKVLTQRSIKSIGEVIVVQKDASASTHSRNAVCKELYGRIFAWIISTINTGLGAKQTPEENDTFIGVLDIFGFESFKHNDFEQLLINYTNEVLQANFNQQVFQAETELYRNEGLHVPPVQWPDNRQCVELIANAKPPGILSLLDAEMGTQKPSDIKFCKELHKQHGFNPYFPKPHAKDIQKTFNVKHFAGKVQYSVGNFIDKNNNSVPAETMQLFQASRLSTLHPPSTIDPEAEAQKAAQASGKRRKKKKVQTVGNEFLKQMNSLVNTLQSTKCSFIRCVKPNEASTFGAFDRSYVQAQVRCQGILQTCEVLRMGLPTRVTYEFVAKQFRGEGDGPGLPDQVKEIFAGQSDKSFVQAVAWAFGLDTNDFKLGITRIFFRVGKMALLRQMLDCDFSPGAKEGERIVSRLQYYVQYKRWRRAYAKVVSMNRFMALLTHIKKRDFMMATRLANAWRAKVARRLYQRLQQEKIEAAARAAEEKRQEMLRLEAERERLEEEAKAAAAEEQRQLQEQAAEAERQRLVAQEEQMKAAAAQVAMEKDAAEREKKHAAVAKMDAQKRRAEKAEAEKFLREEEMGDLMKGAGAGEDDDDDDDLDEDDRAMLVDSYRLCGLYTGTGEEDSETLMAIAHRQHEAETKAAQEAARAGADMRMSLAVEANVKRTGKAFQDSALTPVEAKSAVAKKLKQLNQMKELEWVTDKEFLKLRRLLMASGATPDFPPLASNPHFQESSNTWDMAALEEEYSQMHGLRMQQKQSMQTDVESWLATLDLEQMCMAVEEAGMNMTELQAAGSLEDPEKLKQHLRFIHTPRANEDLRWHVAQLRCPYCEKLNSTLRMVNGYQCRYCVDPSTNLRSQVFTPNVVYRGAQRKYEPDHETYANQGVRRFLLSDTIHLKKFLPKGKSMEQLEAEGWLRHPEGVAGKYTRSMDAIREHFRHMAEVPTKLNGKPYYIMQESEEYGTNGPLFFIGWSGECSAIRHETSSTPILLVTVVNDGSQRLQHDIHGCVGRLLSPVKELDDNTAYDVEVQVWDEEGEPFIELYSLLGSTLLERENGHWKVAELEQLEGLLQQAATGKVDIRFEAHAASEGLISSYMPAELENSYWRQFTVEAEEEGMPSVPYMDGQLQILIYGSLEERDWAKGSPTYGQVLTEYVLLCRWGIGDEPISPERNSYCELWLVAANLEEFLIFDKNMRKQLRPVMPSDVPIPSLPFKAEELKQEKEGASLTKYQRQQAKEKEKKQRMSDLLSYWQDIFEMLTKNTSLCQHLDALEDFLALKKRVGDIKRTEAWQKENGHGSTDGIVAPYNTREDLVNHCQKPIDMLSETLDRLMQENQGDVRNDASVRSLMCRCLAQRQKLQATATHGPFTQPDLIPEAELLLEKLEELIAFYNKEAMMAQTGVLSAFLREEEAEAKWAGMYRVEHHHHFAENFDDRN